VVRPLFLLKLLIRTGLARYLPGVNRLTDGGADFLRYYADPLLAAPRRDLRRADRFLEAPPHDVLDLSTAQPRCDVSITPPRLSSDRRGWPSPWGLPELRAAVAEKLGAEQGLTVSPAEEVLITAGAGGALRTALDALVNRGGRVVLFDPSSPLFVLALKSHRARVCWLYSWNEGGRLCFRLPELDRALRGARLMVLSTPGNPTGGCIAAEDLEQLAWWANKHDVLLIDDQTFAAFRYEGDAVSLSGLSHARDRTLTVGSVSKSHGLTALRVGWLAGNRHLVRACRVGAALRMTLVPTVCQQMALAALREPAEPITALREELAARRHHVHERLTDLGLRATWPAGGLCVWFPVWELGWTGRAFTDRLLEEKRVQLTAGDLFGPSGLGYVRLSFAGDEGRLREGLARLADFMAQIVPKPVTKAA